MGGSGLWSRDWWQRLFASAGRQSLQVLVPVLVLIQEAGGRVDVGAALSAAGFAVALTFAHGVLRGVAGAGDPGVVARAVSAAAGTLAGLVPVSAAGMGGLGLGDWRAMLVAAAAAGVLSVCHWYVDPPRQV